MNNKNILIASVLKPADDTRMLSKMASSLIGLKDFDVHVFGSKPHQNDYVSMPLPSSIHMHTHTHQSRNLLSRIKACQKFYILSLKLRPKITIVNSIDIQLVCVFLNFFFNLKYLYDVRENHFLNIRYQSTYSSVFRLPLALLVRLIERIGFARAAGSIMAESCYVNQMKFLNKKPVLVALNKYNNIDNNIDNNLLKYPVANDIRCLFSGYLSTESGVFTAIDWCVEWQKKYSCLTLHIIGYAPKTATRSKLYELAAKYDWIRLSGIDSLISHPQIIKAIQEANLGILSYRISKANTDKTPTKYFEYQANNLIMISNEENINLLNLANQENIHLAKNFDTLLVSNTKVSDLAKHIPIISNMNANYWNTDGFAKYVLGFANI